MHAAPRGERGTDAADPAALPPPIIDDDDDDPNGAFKIFGVVVTSSERVPRAATDSSTLASEQRVERVGAFGETTSAIADAAELAAERDVLISIILSQLSLFFWPAKKT